MFKTYVFLVVVSLAVCGCQKQKSDASNTEGSSSYGFKISQYTAKYYDGANLVGTETVKFPALRGSKFGVLPANLKVTYEADLDLAFGRAVDGGLSCWDSTCEILVDGVQVVSVSGANAHGVKYLEAGRHKILIKVSTGGNFGAAVTAHDILYVLNGTGLVGPIQGGEATTPQQLGALARPYLSANTRIVYVGASHGSDLDNSIEVSIADASRPVFLVLSSYFAINWIIKPNGAQIKGVIYSAYDNGQTLSVPGGTTSWQVFDTGFTPSTATTILGRAPDHEINVTSPAISVP